MIFLSWSFVMGLLFFLTGGGALYCLLYREVLVVEYSLWEGAGSMSFLMVLDWLSLSFLSLVLLISFCVLVYSKSYMEGDQSPTRFCYLMLLFILSMGLMILSPNLMSLLLGWDGLGLISYILVIYYQNKRSYSAGMLTVLSNRVGDVGLLLGISLLVSEGAWGFFNFSLGEVGASVEMYLGVCIILAAMTSSAQIPFSSWLPAAMAAPTPVSSLVHSSTLVTAGVYLLIRFQDMMNLEGLKYTLLWVSLVTMFLAGLGASLETDMKKVVALSTLSQLGIMMFILALGFWELAYFHLLTHALFKALLFLCSGGVIHGVGGNQDYRWMGGLGNFSPISSSGMLISNFCLMGLPFMSGFYSKDLIIEMVFIESKGMFVMVIFLTSVFLTSFYSLRYLYCVLISGYGYSPLSSFVESPEMNFSIFILGGSAILGGSLLQWFIFDSYEVVVVDSVAKWAPLGFISLSAILVFFFLESYTGSDISFYGIWNFSLFNMWFLPGLNGSLSQGGLAGGSIFLSGESGWGELLGSQGAYSVLGGLSSSLNMMSLLYKFFFFLVVLVLFFFMN